LSEELLQRDLLKNPEKIGKWDFYNIGSTTVKARFVPGDEALPGLIEKIYASINEINNSIKPKQLINPTGLAKQIWQDIWSVSGATPENCLYTFVELFIFKYLSDLGVLGEGFNFEHLLHRYTYQGDNNDEKVLEYYASTVRPEIKKMFPESPVDHTTIINGTIFVSKDQNAVTGYSTVFKKIIFKFRDYGKLENIDYDFKSRLFESFLKESISKKNWGQFFTPLKVVRAMVEMARDDIKPGISICDPACGVGKFLLEPLVTRLDTFYKITKSGIQQNITIRGFDKGFDREEQKTIILAKANMLIYFSDLIKDNPGMAKDFAGLFNESFTLKTNSILGTLSDAVTEAYDLIMTNPPYVTSGSSNLKEEIRKGPDGLSNHYKVNALGVEGLFMEWIIKALKPGGKAFVVVPDGMMIRQNDKNLRRCILEECFIDGLISLPLNTFFTTNKKTYILCLTKKTDRKQTQTAPVFTYLVSEIGETRDVYRFDIDQNDLDEAVSLFAFFKGNKEKFAGINVDKRCKIVPAAYFSESAGTNWVIDNLWTQEEKLALGVIKKDETVSPFDFSVILEDAVNTLRSLQAEMKDFSEGVKASASKSQKQARALFAVDDLFEIKSGNSSLTRKYIHQHKGPYVVYSANTKQNGVFGYIDTFEHDTECIQLTTNGVYAGTFFYREKHRFSINGDARLLIKKSASLDYHFLISELRKAFVSCRFNWENKPSLAKMRLIKISVPVTPSGEFDLAAQKEIAERCRKIEQIKTAVRGELEKIQNTVVDIT